MSPESPTPPTVAIALALIYSSAPDSALNTPTFLMQLRDDKPDILYPGHWGLFGGHLDPGETPEICIHRELMEEIGHDIADLQVFKVVQRQHVLCTLYYGVLDVPTSELVLGEGMDLKLVSVEELQRGEAWSEAIAETRPMGDFHCGVLLEFWEALRQGGLAASTTAPPTVV